MSKKPMLSPAPALLIKLGSIIVHFDEFHSEGGHPVDLHTAKQLLADPDVKDWIHRMTVSAMLPLKRGRP
jgi:hypothetical protein